MMGELYKPGIMKNKSKNIELTTLRMQIREPVIYVLAEFVR